MHDFGGPNPIGGQQDAGRRGPSGHPASTPAAAPPAQQWPGTAQPRTQWQGPPAPQPQPWGHPDRPYPPSPGAGAFGGQPPYPGQQYGPPMLDPDRLGPPPRKRRTRLLAIGAAAVAVIVVVAGVLVFSGGGSNGGGAKTAGEAVQGHLEALSRGDAEAALSFAAATPPDNTFLTDEILKKQLESSSWPRSWRGWSNTAPAPGPASRSPDQRGRRR